MINPRLRIVLLSLALLIVSLFQPAITSRDYNGIVTTEGYTMFLVGSTAILGGGLFEWIIWLANPLALLSIILFLNKKPKARTTSKIALALSLSFLVWQNILASESGREAVILHRNSGYYLWLLSILVLTVGIHKYIQPLPETFSQKNINTTDAVETAQSSTPSDNLNTRTIDPEKVKDFKNKYLDKTTDELNQLSADVGYTTEVKIAAMEIINERTKI